jgi:menaquinone-dependent protoporphyrinogen IX oxidase
MYVSFKHQNYRKDQMKGKILVTYISQSGSTQEIAEKIEQSLREQGLDTDLLEVKDVKNIRDYQGIVLGLPLYLFHWPAAGIRFLNRNRKVIEAGLPMALFTGGPTEKGDEAEWKTIHDQITNEMSKVPWFKPVALKPVGGKLDPLNLAFPWKLIPAMRNLPVSDLRDWNDIQNWATSLPAILSK